MKGIASIAIITIVCMLSMNEQASAQKWSFDYQVAYVDLGNSSDDVATGDLNGDGLVDIIATEDPYISWFRNNGGSRPTWTRFVIADANSIPGWTGEKGWMGMWVGDFDGDNDIDVCAGAKGSFNSISHPTAWFENNGSGGGWTMHVLSVNGDYFDHARSYDFNGDNKDDIIFQKYHGGGVYYVPGGGWTPTQIGTGSSGVSLFDVNRDGKMDVLVDNTWLKNPGNPATPNWQSFTITGSSSGVKNAAGDLNGDGYVDVVHTSEEGSGIWYYFGPPNPETGTWQKHSITPSPAYSGTHTCWLADFDLDNDLDILTAEMHTSSQKRVTIFENANGDGSVWTEHIVATTGSHNALAADVNNDAMADIVGFNYDDPNPLEVWYNDCWQTFGDVLCSHWAFDYIEALVASGVTSGCQVSPPLYCPDSNVQRDQMAVFIIKALAEIPVTPCTGVFADVPASYWACGYIERLVQLSITSGCSPGIYCPLNYVQRNAMAVFLIKALAETPVSPCAGVFLDVPASYWACGHIERLVQLGITSGCVTNYYCPSMNVNRGQMAKFLVLAFAL